MPGLNGLDVTRQLHSSKCKTMIIALTIHDNDNYVSVNDFFYKINLIKDFKHNCRSTYIYKDTCVVLYSHI